MRILSVILLFVFLALFFTHSLTSINQDIGRHLKSGEIIWQTKQVYKSNLFSFTEPNHPFVNHHWLSEVIFYGLDRLIGLKGLIIFKTVVLLAAFGLIFKAVQKQTGWGLLLATAPLGLLVFNNRSDVRPEIFSYLFFAFFLFALWQAKYQEQERWLYFLPLLQIVWTNLHIYFITGPLLLFFFLLDRLAHKNFQYRYLWIFLTASVVTLLNPNFFRGALLPLNILRHYGYSIVENQSVSFLKNYGILLRNINLFEFSLIFLVISFVLALKRGGRTLPNFVSQNLGGRKLVFEGLTAAAFSVLALKMIRNFSLYALVFIPVAALNLRFSANKSSARSPVWGYILASSLLILLVIITVNNQLYRWLETGKQFGLIVPASAEKGVDFIKENRIPGPVFNNFDVGSFLVWKLYPEQKVFVDGRPEAYSRDFFEKIYKPMQEDPAFWKKYSEEYKINYIFFDHHDITPWAQTFLQNITKNPKWAPVYLDDSVIILLRQNPVNQKLIEKYKITKT